MAELGRLTTEYVENEDRFRLSGIVDDAAPVVLWVSQRLLLRLLPPLLQWLEQKAGKVPRADVLNAFAQQKAQSQMERQEPVVAGPESAQWLVSSIDLARGQQGVRLTLKGAAQQEVRLTLSAPLLRQWLSIVHAGFRRAGWPMSVWPEWMGGEPQIASSFKAPALLH